MPKKVNQFKDNEVLETNSVVSTSDEESEPEVPVPIPIKPKSGKKPKAQPKALKKKKIGAVTYDILKDPPKAGPSNEPMENYCKMGRDFNLILLENT